MGGLNSQDPASDELRDFEAMVQTFTEANFNDVGKQNIGYMAKDEKQLVHHGAHSMPRQQVLARHISYNSVNRSAFGRTGSSAYPADLAAFTNTVQARDDEQRLKSRSALGHFGGTRGD